ncbi:Phosphatidylethanolamine N-methyltransferase [hydrothermal vent metagenome]|uniref:Phosphatidylethanolamine N-methyltransferase n=1 Tax=hydrothermal vent metagenome TaxID=652676 RepID=A0A3B1BSJ5_9ZZZZ
MNDHIARWNNASKCFDLANVGIERRYGKYKRMLFTKCRGKVLLVAAGTGLDFPYFPEGLEITAIDFSPKMVEKAKEKLDNYNGKLKVVEADVMSLDFPDGSFDTVATSCTFCSVPDPVKGLKEIYRVLKPDSRLLMFEHVRAGAMALGAMMDIMTPLFRKFGPEINRRTGENIRKAGFTTTREYNVYLDMVKLFEAVRP